MLLAAVADVRDDLGFDDMTDINEAIKGALHAAEPRIAAALRADFKAKTGLVDVFYVNQPKYQLHLHVQTEFLLRYGFVTQLTSAFMSDFPTIGDDKYDLLANSRIVPSADDLAKGVLRDYQTQYCRAYVAFTYNAGFPADGTDATSYDLTVVPSWLQQAAKLAAKIMLDGTSILKEAGVTQQVEVLQANYDQLIEQHVRYAPVAMLPL